MSLMAGFDFVTEISTASLLQQIKSRVQIANHSLNPPFELDLPISAIGISGNVHLIVYDVWLDLVADHGCRLTLLFNNLSVIATIASSPQPVILSALSGAFVITTSIQFVNVGGWVQRLAVDLSTAATSVIFSPEAETKIATGLAGTPITRDAFQQFAEDAFEDFVRSTGVQFLAGPCLVDPSRDGELSAPIEEGGVVQRFNRIEVHNIGGQALGLFGILLAAHHANGSPPDKLVSGAAITPGHGVSVSIAPEAFHVLLFCPSFSGGSDVAALPPRCGTASGWDKDGITITYISTAFAVGRIDVNVGIKKEGPCYSAVGSLNGPLTLAIKGAKITPSVALEPDIDVSIDSLCEFFALRFLGPLGFLMAKWSEEIGSKLAETLAKSLIPKLEKIDLPETADATYDQVNITPEGVTFNGRADPVLVTPQRHLAIDGSVTNAMPPQEVNLSDSVFHIDSGCLKGDYPYKEYVQQQVGLYHIVPHLLGRPLVLEWRIEYWKGFYTGYSSPVRVSGETLNAPGGTVVLPNVETTYPVPLPTGSSLTQSVHIGYSIADDTITLTPVDSAGAYAVTLIVKATDPLNNVLEAEIAVPFERYFVVVDGDYQEKYFRCQLAKIKEMTRRMPVESRPFNPPHESADPRVVINFARFLVKVGTPEAEELLAHTVLAYGKSFNRALFFGRAGNGGREKAKTVSPERRKSKRDQS